jgi:MFS family permease
MGATLKHPATSIELGRQADNAWRVLALLFVANLINIYDRVIPAVIAEPLREEFKLTDLHIGLFGTVFTIVYALAGIPLGRMADSGSRKKILGWGLALWSGFTAFTGMAGGFISFLAMRVGVGIGEASYAPAATSLISDLFPGLKRSRAIGIFMLGQPLGLVLAFFTAGAIAHAFDSWRAPFFAAAVPGILLAAAFIFIREPKRGASEAFQAASATAVANPIRTVLSVRTIRWIVISGIGHNFAAFATNTFMVPLLQRYFHIPLKTAAIYTGVMVGLTGLVALILGGMLADRLQQRYQRGRLILCTAAMVMATVFTFLAMKTDNLTAFVWLFGAGWFASYFYTVCTFPTVQELVVPQLRATAMAVYFGAMALLGSAVGALSVGGLSDYYARAMQLAEGASLLSNAHRATGLHDAMILVPVALLVTTLACVMATRAYRRDIEGATGL